MNRRRLQRERGDETTQRVHVYREGKWWAAHVAELRMIFAANTLEEIVVAVREARRSQGVGFTQPSAAAAGPAVDCPGE